MRSVRHVEVIPAERTVLLADGDVQVCARVAGALLEDYALLVAHEPQQALELLKATRVDAVVVGHGLPLGAGLEVLRRAQELQPLAVRVLLSSSLGVEEAAEAVNRARVHRLVAEPWGEEALRAALAGALLEQEQRRQNARELEEFAACTAAALQRERELVARVETLSAELQRLEALALRDSLTGLYNQVLFREQLEVEVSRARRYARHLALLLFSLDGLEDFNARCGRAQGDALLRELAGLLRSTTAPADGRPRRRLSDLPFRLGGGHFALLLPETDGPGARVGAERLREQVRTFRFPGLQALPGWRLTASLGLATFPEHAASMEGLLAAAEHALAEARAAGGDRLCTALRGQHGAPR